MHFKFIRTMRDKICEKVRQLSQSHETAMADPPFSRRRWMPLVTEWQSRLKHRDSGRPMLMLMPQFRWLISRSLMSLSIDRSQTIDSGFVDVCDSDIQRDREIVSRDL
jgi:hypothetical protein